MNIIAELAGAEVCVLAGIPAPQPGLIRFPKDPKDANHDNTSEKDRKEVETIFKMNSGKIAFCCAYICDSPDLDVDVISGRYGLALTQQWGATLLALDAYIRHDDRRCTNPNALVFGEAIIAVDHGAAFAGMSQPGMTGRALAMRTVIQSSLHEHVFFSAVRKWYDKIDWNGVRDRLRRIGRPQIAAAASWWPEELEPHRTHVVEFLLERQAHVDTIVENVAELTKPRSKA